MFTSIKKYIFIFILVGLAACQENKEQIIIETPSGQQAVFSISIAQTQEQQKKGLMFVEEMPQDEGMIFLYPTPSITKFWMKNTLIPLDMLFFDNNNQLVHIEYSATPHDETPRGPDSPICSVVEINGGLADKMNIATGSKLISNLTQECLQSSAK